MSSDLSSGPSVHLASRIGAIFYLIWGAFHVKVARAVAAGELTIILKALESAPQPVSFVHQGGPPIPLKLRAFLDYATPRLREGPAQ